MRTVRTLILVALISSMLLPPWRAAAQSAEDFDIPNGHFFTQTNGQPVGTGTSGFAVTNDAGISFWDAFQQLGGVPILGYPVTHRFTYDGFVTQAMQKMVFQWRPDTRQVVFLNTFDALHDKGFDSYLSVVRQTPPPFDTSPDTGLSFDQVVARHLTFLDQNEAIKSFFLSDPSWLDHYGLPVSYADEGNSFVIRAQRATFQYWKEAVPWAAAGQVTVANGGDIAKEAGLWPAQAVIPSSPPASTTTPTVPAPAPVRAKTPDYSMNIFIYGHPDTTQRDLEKVKAASFSWQKTLFQWRDIEGAGKGIFNWSESDRVVRASNDAGVKILARLDFQPGWARADGANNGPPDNYQDFSDFVFALVDRYKTGSPFGHIDAIEMWNEPNLSREWGDQTPNAADYVRLLRGGYQAAKRADPSVTVISAGLTPTGTYDANATPDDIYLQQMYDAGAKSYFDVLGAHAAGYKAPPEMSPAQVAADPAYGGNRVFTFRRVEDLRAVMEKNGDADKQMWVTEFGWTSDPVHPQYAWHQVTEQQKADYLVRAFQWAKNNWPWMGVMTVWNLPAPDWGPDREEYWWSIANPDGTDRPAYTALRNARQSGQLP